MQKKHNALFLILGIIALVFTAYALFTTVFNQLIIQNEGFFYALVFGGILILVYVFADIVLKLMSINDGLREHTAFKVICIILLLLLCVVFAFTRLSYTSTINFNESDIYHAATLLNNGSLSVSREMTDMMLQYPAQFALALIYSFLFNFIPDAAGVEVIVNVFFCCISAVLCFCIVYKLTDGFCAVISAGALLFLPGNLFSVYSISPDCMVAVPFLAAILSLTCLLSSSSGFKIVLNTVLYGVFTGIMCFLEPVYAITLIIIPIVLMGTHRRNAVKTVISSIIAAMVCILLLYSKALLMDSNIAEVSNAFIRCFNPFINYEKGASKSFGDLKEVFDLNIASRQNDIENNYSFLINKNGESVSAIAGSWMVLLNQLMYMFYLVLSLGAIINILQNKDKRITPEIVLTVLCTIIMFFESNREVYTFYYHSLFALISSMGYFYMYLNHHPDDRYVFSKVYSTDIYVTELEKMKALEVEEISEEEKELQRQQFILRANAVVFIDDNRALYNMIRAEERSQLDLTARIEANAETQYTDNVLEDAQNNSEASHSGNLTDYMIPSESSDSSDHYIPSGSDIPYADTGSPDNIISSGNFDKTSEAEDDTPVTYIPNPLPVPTRRPHQKIDFDIAADSDDDWDV